MARIQALRIEGIEALVVECWSDGTPIAIERILLKYSCKICKISPDIYCLSVHLQKQYNLELSVNKFRANLKSYVDKAIAEHKVLLFNRRSRKDFAVMSAEDWERKQETLYVMRNQSLMNQVAESLQTY